MLRWAAPPVYVAVLSVVIYRDGVPVSRERLLVWILLGLLAFSLATCAAGRAASCSNGCRSP